MRFIVFSGSLALFLIACGKPQPGESCFEDEDCGDLSCQCAEDDGEFPGVCSPICEKDADCASYGDRYTCVIDFCSGTNVCLQDYEVQ